MDAIVSLAHLNHLRDDASTSAGKVPFWWVYCEAVARDPLGPYRRIGAAGEGDACVDDVARALIVYLKYGEMQNDPNSLCLARDAIRFLQHMRAPDGTFYNWMWADGSRNE